MTMLLKLRNCDASRTAVAHVSDDPRPIFLTPGMETEVWLHQGRSLAVEEEPDVGDQKAPPDDYLLQFFAHEHLPPALAAVSRPFCELAVRLVRELPRNPERTVALRKLLEAKDCAVRALLSRPEP